MPPLPLKHFLGLCGLFSLAILGAATSTPIVDLGYAKYAGLFNETSGTTRFLGIRYAASPTGPLRWQAPQTPEMSLHVQRADTDPPTCISAPAQAPTSDPSQSEDCLFLNVFTPGEISSTNKLPVVVWIHGGGYGVGSAYGFDGDDLIKTANGNVVAVILQYRLGLFGFLPGKEVKKNGALNAGLLDQQFALQWVQKNIHKFNGNPSRVTIWGQSAGAGSVLQHIVANGGKTSPPLFQKAMASSPWVPPQYHYDDPIPESLYNQVISQTNCLAASNTLDCLRNVSLATLEAANINVKGPGQSVFMTLLFVPVVDGDFIQERPFEALKQNKINGDAVLSVSNSFEGLIFVNPEIPNDADVANYVTQLYPTLDVNQSSRVVALYKAFGSPYQQLQAIIGESFLICPSYFLARAFGARGYKAEFAIPPAHHGDDLAYYFPNYVSLFASTPDSLIQPAHFKDPSFIKAFSQSFMDFVVSGDPNRKVSSTITPSWVPWDGPETEMLFNRTSGGAPDVKAVKASGALLRRCDFWHSIAFAT